MSEDFSDLLMEDVSEPVHAPDGTWTATIISGKWKKQQREKGPANEALFTMRLSNPGDDVSPEELDARGDMDAYTPVFHQIPIWERSQLWNVKRFALMAGFPEDSIGALSMEALTPELKGHEVRVTVEEQNIPGYDTPKLVITSISSVE